MLKFRVRNIVPPGNKYFWHVSETDVVLEDPTRTGLRFRIDKHYAENGLVVPIDIMDQVEDYICRHIPEGFCYGDIEGRPRARAVTLSGIKENTKKLVLEGGRVDPGEAYRRSVVCGKCLNNDRTLCPTCVGLVSWSQKLVGQKAGGMMEWMGVCAVDLTAIPAKVYVKNVPADAGYPKECWNGQRE